MASVPTIRVGGCPREVQNVEQNYTIGNSSIDRIWLVLVNFIDFTYNVVKVSQNNWLQHLLIEESYRIVSCYIPIAKSGD